jgi:ABC transport system ATP-binding/permease protein
VGVPPRNLINVESATVSFGVEPVLDGVSLGVAQGDRIGIVGRNGGGKSTLLSVIAGERRPDTGRVSHTGGARIGVLGQQPTRDGQLTVRDVVVGDSPDHEWASDPRARAVAEALLGVTSAQDPMWLRAIGDLSGGERRRVELASLLVADLDVLLLDEPTNHLDVEAVDWLAGHIRDRRGLAVLVVTHDRWFLDAITDRTWEVVRGEVAEYEGGYSAFVLAKAERMRQADAAEARRRNLMRKELAWLRRGPPARTSKPKFRIDAANELIGDEPPPRDNAQLLRFAGSRLGRSVVDLDEVIVARGERLVLDHVTWGLGPGDRVAVLGPNGVGKSTLAGVIAGVIPPDQGRVSIGATVVCAVLSQQLDELNPHWRLLEAVEDVARHVHLADGSTLSASQLAERLGFGADRQWVPVGDLSGGERRRLQLTRLLMGEPNVLILDEPTNDFDVETLTALEDLLDSFAGTLLVITHDRYFAERVCDSTVGLLGDGSVRDLPGGIDEYLRVRGNSGLSSSAVQVNTAAAPEQLGSSEPSQSPPDRSPAEERLMRKELERIERTLTKLRDEQTTLHDELAACATDAEAVRELGARLRVNNTRSDELEQRWLDVAEALE